MGRSSKSKRNKRRKKKNAPVRSRKRAAAPPPKPVEPEVVEVPWWAEELDDPQHIVFLQEMIKQKFNATRAYIAAGYSTKGAAQGASRLLTNVKVKAAYEKLKASVCMPVDELRALIEDDARASLDDFTDIVEVINEEDGTVSYVPRIDWKAAKEAGALRYLRELNITPGKYGDSIRFKLVDDQKAKDQLIKIHGLAVHRTEITGKDGGPIKQKVETTQLPVKDMSDEALAEMEFLLAKKGQTDD